MRTKIKFRRNKAQIFTHNCIDEKNLAFYDHEIIGNTAPYVMPSAHYRRRKEARDHQWTSHQKWTFAHIRTVTTALHWSKRNWQTNQLQLESREYRENRRKTHRIHNLRTIQKVKQWTLNKSEKRDVVRWATEDLGSFLLQLSGRRSRIYEVLDMQRDERTHLQLHSLSANSNYQLITRAMSNAEPKLITT